jgi:hypothetical protein
MQLAHDRDARAKRRARRRAVARRGRAGQRGVRGRSVGVAASQDLHVVPGHAVRGSHNLRDPRRALRARTSGLRPCRARGLRHATQQPICQSSRGATLGAQNVLAFAASSKASP